MDPFQSHSRVVGELQQSHNKPLGQSSESFCRPDSNIYPTLASTHIPTLTSAHILIHTPTTGTFAESWQLAWHGYPHVLREAKP